MEEQVTNNQAVDAFFDTPGVDPLDGRLAGDSIFDVSAPETSEGQKGDTLNPENPQGEKPVEGAPIPSPQIDYETENRALKQQLAELQLYKPLGEMIQRNPNFLSAVESSLKQMQAEPVQPKIEKPSPPAKPAAFDPQEAITVPGSESWKYREALDGYNHEMFAYYEKRDQAREEAQSRALEAYQNQIAQAEVRRELTSELMTRYGYTKERVDDFIKVMSDPESRSIENLVALHQMQSQKRGAKSVDASKAQAKNVPLPVGVIGGGGAGTAQKLTDADAFNLGLLSARR